jgi:transposase
VLTEQINSSKAGPEVVANAKRRQFSVEDKRRLVAQYDSTPRGERGAFLRRNGLYTSYIDDWRKQIDGAVNLALEPQKRGPKPQPKPDPELLRLQRENARLKAQLSQARKVIEVQKKISEILGVDQTLPDELKNEDF